MSNQRLHLQLHPLPPKPHTCLYVGPCHRVLADGLRAEVMGIPYTKFLSRGEGPGEEEDKEVSFGRDFRERDVQFREAKGRQKRFLGHLKDRGEN